MRHNSGDETRLRKPMKSVSQTCNRHDYCDEREMAFGKLAKLLKVIEDGKVGCKVVSFKTAGKASPKIGRA